MNLENYKSDFEYYLYLNIGKVIEKILGADETAVVSTGLFMRLPIQLNLIEVESLPEIDETAKISEDQKILSKMTSAYVKVGERIGHRLLIVFFDIIYSCEEDLKNLLKVIKVNKDWAPFVYLHELQHILRSHTEKSVHDGHIQKCEEFNSKYKKKMSKEILESVPNRATDYIINQTILDTLFVKYYNCSNTLEFKKIYLYNPKLFKNFTDVEVMEYLIENSKIKTSVQKIQPKQKSNPNEKGDSNDQEQSEENNKDSNDQEQSEMPESIEVKTTEITLGDGSKQVIHEIQTPGKCSCDSGDSETSEISRDIGNDISNYIDSSSNSKGNSSNSILADLGRPIKIKVDWVRELKKGLLKKSNQLTEDYFMNWSGLNNKLRHVYMSPKRNNIKKHLNFYIAIDQSGSVGDIDLRKMMFILQELSKKASTMILWVHDTQIVKEIELDFESLGDFSKFKTFLTHRYSCGGTSHECIFKEIQRLDKRILQQSILITMSDMYSDIDRHINNYPAMNIINKWWIHSKDSQKIQAGGRHVYLG